MEQAAASQRQDYFLRFEDFAQSVCQHSIGLCLAGVDITFRHCGQSLAEDLLAALAHWVPTEGNSQIIIYLCDSQLSGLFPPPPPPEWFLPAPRGEVVGWTSEPIFACQNTQYGLACLWDQPRQKGIFWCRSHQTLPTWERASPLRSMLHWVFSSRSAQFCHAAVVGQRGRGLMLVGRGGSGKSTTALLCLSQGWQYIGDDYVLVLDGQAYPLYSTAKLVEREMTRMASFPIRRREADGAGKIALWLVPEAMTASLPIAAMVLPKVAENGESSLESCSSALAVQALAPTTMLQLAAAGPAQWQRLTELAHSQKCYQMGLGRDSKHLLELLDSLC